ncbi:MAG TPA: sigma-70 family RNA polymerase sigma factor, partial [Pirellulales bacterium]|nr:sigma-70 family RNA polymerase sigma factor [Pirellulales bacterium]
MVNQMMSVVQRERRSAVSAETAPELPDRDLLDRFVRDRDEAAFSALVKRHGGMVLGVCRRVLRNGHDAEDACQATFLVLARKAATIRKQASLASWLYGVAYHVAKNLKRNHARRNARHAALGEMRQAAASGDAKWLDVQQALDEELSQLAERFRIPLVLCYLEGKTRDEAARQVGWSLGTLRGRLDRGRELLRQRLVRRGLTLPAAAFAIGLTQSTASAAMPSTLAGATVKAGLAFAAGSVGGASGVSARVALLAQGALKAMIASKAKAVGSLLGIALVTGTIVQQLPLDDDGHRGDVQVVVFSPAGDRLASGGADGSIRFWDVATMQPIGKLDGSAGRGVSSLSFAPGGDRLASGSDDGTLDLWDLNERKRQYSVTPSSARVGSIAFSAEGKVVVSGRHDGSVAWTGTTDPADGARSGFQAERDAVCAMAFSPDRTSVAWGMSDGRVTIYDVETRQLKATHAKHQQAVTALEFNHDGWSIASASLDGSVKMWAAGCGAEPASFQGHPRAVRSVAVRGERMATGGDDGTVRLWDTRTGEQLEVYTGHQKPVLAVAFSPGGELVA